MALVVKDRVQETTITVGTISVVLSGAVTGFQTFSSAIGNGNTTYYTIQGDGEWEVGIGTVGVGTLSRDTVLESSNGGSLVDFSIGSKFVFCTYPAEKSVDIETAQTLTNKTISGSSNTLSNIGNSSLTNSSITINGSSVSLGGSTSVGTVNSVGGTGNVNGISLSGTVTSSGNLTLGGTLSGVSLTTQVSGTLPIANGGTGETTRQAAMDALAGSVTSGQYLRGNGADVVMSAIQAGDVPTLNQNTTGSAARAPEWQGSGSTSDWNQQFRDTDASSATQVDLNSGTNCPTGSGWWFAESFRHGNSSNFWGLQYAHGWEDRANQRWTRNVSSNNFADWRLDVGCRAWVAFNGTGTPSIQAAQNVSSISDNGNGDYTINMTVAQADANYCVSGTSANSSGINGTCTGIARRATASPKSSSSFRVFVVGDNGTFQDVEFLNYSIFR